MKLNAERITDSILMELPYTLAMKVGGLKLVRIVREAVQKEVESATGETKTNENGLYLGQSAWWVQFTNELYTPVRVSAQSNLELLKE